MANTREIRTKISSIKGTQKITSAMELVAASKMRKAQVRMQTAKPYSEKMRAVMGHVANSHSEYRHPFLIPREKTERAGVIIVSTDRGLCGGLNFNLFKKAVIDMQQWQKEEIGIDLCLVGVKAKHFFSRHGAKVVAHADHLGDAPAIADLIGLVKVMLDAYSEGKIDSVSLYYNEFVNTMTQNPQRIQLLPIQVADDETGQVGYWDYLYEPDSKQILDALLIRYIESQVYQAVIENIACEQAARMVAMKSATDNAEDLIKELQLDYNKIRQAAITCEIAEIVGGAAAIE